MADLARSSFDTGSDSGGSGPSRDTSIHTASPELVAQVSHLEALLSSQQTELNDLVQTDSTLPGQDQEEDDDLAAEIAELAESEDLLRRELEQLMAGQLQLKLNRKVWITSVRDDPNILSNNILNNDRQRGWVLWWHVTIRASLALAIIAIIMLSKPIFVERQGAWSRKTQVVAGLPLPEDMDSTLVAFKPSTSERIFPGDLRVFDLSTAEPSVRMPGTSEASAIISVTSSSRSPSSTGQTTIACFALSAIPANNLPLYSSVGPFELARIEATSWQASSQSLSSLGVLASTTFQSNRLPSRLVQSHPLNPPACSAPQICSTRTVINLATELERSQALDAVKLYATQPNLSRSMIPFLSWNITNPVTTSSRACRGVSETGLVSYHLELQLLAGANGTSITSCGSRCKLEMMGNVHRTDEASVGVALSATRSYEERAAPTYNYERPQQGPEGADWRPNRVFC
jgi:hypothetical protein